MGDRLREGRWGGGGVEVWRYGRWWKWGVEVRRALMIIRRSTRSGGDQGYKRWRSLIGRSLAQHFSKAATPRVRLGTKLARGEEWGVGTRRCFEEE